MERLSVLATLPRFREMERQHGSLIRAMRRQMALRRKTNASTESQSGARYSMFLTLRNGLTSIVDALAARLPQGSVRLETAVQRLEPAAQGWTLTLTDSARETFDAVIVATASHVAGRLLEPLDASLGGQLLTIEHSGTAIVSVGYRRGQISHPLDGMGAVVPATERSPVLACSFSSQKYAHRAPEGHVLLRIFAGGARAPELAEMDDARLCPLLLTETSRLLGIKGEPDHVNVAHWPGTMPQYHVGHCQRVAQIERRAAALPNLALAGNAYHGVGIPNCIHSGERAAERILGKESGEEDTLSGGGM
jgi:oxygen-dependent protoporphyrinogen oxidase